MIEWNGLVVCKDCYDPKHPTIGQKYPVFDESVRNARPQANVTLSGGDRDGVCKAQAAVAAGNLTINGALATAGVATLPDERPVTIYSASSQTHVRFTISGTNLGGVTIYEIIWGNEAGETLNTNQQFKTVTIVNVSGATSGDVEIGSADVASGLTSN